MTTRKPDSGSIPRILVIDDYAVQLGYEDLFNVLGYSTQIATTGAQGLKLIAQNPPDLIILDANLPYMSGFDVARQVRDNPDTTTIPIVIVSVEEEAIAEAAEATGINAYMVKPLNLDQVDRVIRKLLRDRLTVPAAQPSERLVELMLAVGELHNQAPDDLFPNLRGKSRRTWTGLLALALRSRQLNIRGRAVIAIALWHNDGHAPFNKTEAQEYFWYFVRHSLASSSAKDAELKWCRLVPVAVALMNKPAEIATRLKSCLESDDWECRLWALNLLFLTERAGMLDYAATLLLSDSSGDVRMMAAMIFSKQAAEIHIPLLAKAMSDPQPSVREHVAAALAKIGSDTAVYTLKTILLHSKPGSAEGAAKGLSLIGNDEATIALIEAVHQREEINVLQQIAHALGSIGTLTARQGLIRLVQHSDPAVREITQTYLQANQQTDK